MDGIPVVVKVYLHRPSPDPGDSSDPSDAALAAHAERLGQVRRRLCFPPGKCPNLLPYQRWVEAEVGHRMFGWLNHHPHPSHLQFRLCVLC